MNWHLKTIRWYLGFLSVVIIGVVLLFATGTIHLVIKPLRP